MNSIAFRASAIMWFTVALMARNAFADSYQYRVFFSGEQNQVSSEQELFELFASFGQEYAVLEQVHELPVNDNLSFLVYRAPEVVGEPGTRYGVTPAHPLVDRDHLYEEYTDTDSYSAALAALTSIIASYGAPAPIPIYSGISAHHGQEMPYQAFVQPDKHPTTVVKAKSHTERLLPYCYELKGSGRVAAGNLWFFAEFSPDISGSFCEYRDGVWWKTRLQAVSSIATMHGFYCPAGYTPNFTLHENGCSNTRELYVWRERMVTCSVDPPKPLEELIEQYHDDDPQMAQMTRDLEDGKTLSLRDMLTPEAQTAETCVSSKFTAGGFNYALESTRRPLAYQAHFYDLYQRWLEHGEVDEGSPEWEACAERREFVELEMGRRVKASEGNWNAPGGRFHQIVQAASPSGSKHPDGRAFDVSGVAEVITYLTKDGPPTMTVQDWVNQPNDCAVGWGGLFANPDTVHFYLRHGEQQMELIALIAALTAGVATEAPSELPERLHYGEPQWARLLVSGEHDGEEVVYHYTIVNQHPDTELMRLQLGYHYEDGYEEPYLDQMPVGAEVVAEPDPQQPGFNRFRTVLPDSAWSAPPHWLIQFTKLEFYPDYYLNFIIDYPSAKASVGEIQPGDQLGGFSIRLPKADPTYYETGFEASYYYPSKNYFGYPEKLDNTPPELSVSVDEPRLWSPDNKLVDINVTINVMDDYDGQPAIKLVSITANETLEPGDIEGAEFGEDDRGFKLRASRDGRNHEGRIYTITYEATDAMANTVQKSVDVTVAHDRRH